MAIDTSLYKEFYVTITGPEGYAGLIYHLISLELSVGGRYYAAGSETYSGLITASKTTITFNSYKNNGAEVDDAVLYIWAR